MNIFAVNEKFSNVPMIKHKFELIANAINDRGRKYLTKYEETSFKKSLHLINCQTEAMCKILKIEACKCQLCSEKLSRKRISDHSVQGDENVKKSRSVKKKIFTDGPKIDQTRSVRKSLSNLSKKTSNKQTNRNVVQLPEHRKEFNVGNNSNNLELLRKKLKKNVYVRREGWRRGKYSNNDLKIFRDYFLSIPNADYALDYFGISLQQFSQICCNIRKFVDSSFHNPMTKKQKEEENIYNCYIENGLEATVKRYKVTKNRVWLICRGKSACAIRKVDLWLKRLKRTAWINSTKSGNNDKKKQPLNSSMIKKEEKNVIFEIFTSFNRMNYPLNVSTVLCIVKRVKCHFDQSDQLVDVDKEVGARLLSEYQKMK